MCVNRRINATAVVLNETSMHPTFTCWACWGFWPKGSFRWENVEWQMATAVLPIQHFTVCIHNLILQQSCDQFAQWPTFYTRMLNMQIQLVDFFFLYVLFRVTVWKNQLVIRFCAAVGYAVSFSLQAAVGVWNGQAGKGIGIHVRSTQPVPKLDHVSASTRSLQMEHKSPLTSWKMTGNQFCTIYGINAMEISLLTKNKRLSV